jgi:nucleolar complex protein 3
MESKVSLNEQVNHFQVPDKDSDFEEGDEEEEEKAKGKVVNGENGVNEQQEMDLAGEQKTVLALMSEREDLLQELKIKVGSMAANFLENPQERIYVLEKLVSLLDTTDPRIKTVGFKLVSSTVNEMLKDVIPNYSMDKHHEGGADGKLKKETLGLQKFERGILLCAKTFLVKLEKHLQGKGGKLSRGNSSLAAHSIKCMADLLVAHPQFNYAGNICNLLVPFLNAGSNENRAVVKEAVKIVFRADKKGDISQLLVGCIKRLAKARNFNIHPDVIDSMLSLKLSYVPKYDPEAEEVKREKKKRAEMLKRVSKKEKKRAKQLKALEKELLEAKGEEGKQERERNFTAVARVLFEMLFSVIKTIPHQRLLPPTLKCISIHCHAINVDFFHDLLRVLSELMHREELGLLNRMLCVKSTFDILCGPGEFLTFDPSTATRTLLELMPALDLNKNLAGLVTSILVNALVKRKKHVSKDLIRSFVKTLSGLTLQAGVEESAKYLECLTQVRNAHFATFEALLMSDEEMLAMPPHLAALPGFGVGTLWELHLLRSHLQSSTATIAANLTIIRKT